MRSAREGDPGEEEEEAEKRRERQTASTGQLGEVQVEHGKANEQERAENILTGRWASEQRSCWRCSERASPGRRYCNQGMLSLSDRRLAIGSQQAHGLFSACSLSAHFEPGGQVAKLHTPAVFALVIVVVPILAFSITSVDNAQPCSIVL